MPKKQWLVLGFGFKRSHNSTSPTWPSQIPWRKKIWLWLVTSCKESLWLQGLEKIHVDLNMQRRHSSWYKESNWHHSSLWTSLTFSHHPWITLCGVMWRRNGQSSPAWNIYSQSCVIWYNGTDLGTKILRVYFIVIWTTKEGLLASRSIWLSLLFCVLSEHVLCLWESVLMDFPGS